jgi:hypothetical protein
MNRETRAVSYYKLTWSDLIWVTGLAGSLLGILLNALLIWTIRKNRIRLYARLFLSAAIFDLFLSVMELLTQHVSSFGPPCILIFSKLLLKMESCFIFQEELNGGFMTSSLLITLSSLSILFFIPKLSSS